jgi:tRNA threonylcarbamoyl adenosine modification protein (Sua5/YciO/YrdC/YwlC family)
MEILNKDELRLKKEIIKARILKGEVFIHPTDTIYGIGCSIINPEAVQKVREIKQRDKRKPFSVIMPSIEKIRECCKANDEAEEWFKKLPGPYTLLLPIKENTCIPENVNAGRDSIGVRVPDHWIYEFVKELGVPIITASANIRGQDYMTSLEDLDPRVKNKVDFIIYEGEKTGQPSTLINIAKVDIDFSKTRKVI